MLMVHCTVSESPLFMVTSENVCLANIPRGDPAVPLKRPDSFTVLVLPWVLVNVVDNSAVADDVLSFPPPVELVQVTVLNLGARLGTLLLAVALYSLPKFRFVLCTAMLALLFPIAMYLKPVVSAPLQLATPAVPAEPTVAPPAAPKSIFDTQFSPLLTIRLSDCLYALMLPSASVSVVVTCPKINPVAFASD